ncbi:methyltransferase domain-containing protein [Celerinatantimonas diazotrophica]|uniref:tRNA 5-carboxymethoxyuridine methyltransferase n=1 Tax=Celerinatantimonas diazotrophica TaxID=412034 RepID=A0A4R1J7T9_9GAMM|nr:methyltransferase domain-containing protein [Celerinatantimonas diazotrophica]TCK46609.1 S-adenosylmethionine-dependent methyltransferase [Celerinatantimonas diazotrophica]CAG9296659.1 tRNA 5-carboxymethoxyuridine methyltransferase [Celerinatantimonas diazotrophica]
MSDKNFDTLSQKFTRNIYGTVKGQIRIAILMRDLEKHCALTQRKLRILDAGGGFGYLSQRLAAMGHEVVLCDISEQLLNKARDDIQRSSKKLSIQLIQCAIQDLPDELGQFDLVLCHAVLEWLENGHATLNQLRQFIRPGGYFSLMFYNIEAQRFHALVCGNFSYIKNGLKAKKTVRLTPQHAYTLSTIKHWIINQWQFNLLHTSGVRVIHDYLKAGAKEQFSDSELIEMELQYSTHSTYIELGRYIHIIAKNSK